MKKNLPILIVAVVIAAAVAVYFFTLKPVNVFIAIPDSAIAIVETGDWTTLNKQLSATGPGNQLRKTELLQRLNSEVSVIEQTFAADKTLMDIISSSKIVTSVHLVSADDYDFLFTSSMRGLSDKSFLEHLQSTKNVKVNVRSFKRDEVLDVVLKDGRQITFSKIHGILSFSFTSFLAENAITAVTGANIDNDKGFSRVQNHFSGKTSFNLFINFKKADVLFPVSFREEKIPLLQDISSFADWGAYGISLADDEIKLNGIALSKKENGKPSTKNLLENPLLTDIPDNSAYVHLSLLPASGSKNATTEVSYFKDWMGEAKAFVVLEPLTENFNEQAMLVIQCNDKGKALNDLRQLGATGGSPDTAVDAFHGNPIFNLKNADALNRVFQNNFITFGNPADRQAGSYYIVLDNAVVVCNSPNVLKLALEKIKSGGYISKDAGFRQTTEGHLSTGDELVYVNPARCSMLFKSLMKENSSLANVLSSYQGIMAISSYDGEWISTSAIFKTGKNEQNLGGVLWKTKLQTVSGYAPQIVTNVNTGEKEIFTEDTAGNIYLLDKSGQILFTKNIGGRIISPVYQLDYYNNGKLQYIFNTQNHVYLVDRYGNYVAAYPLKLTYPATAAMTLVFDSILRSYRYCVPCANASIYGYESTGRPLYGWSPRSGTGIINYPLRSIQKDKVNYLLAMNTAGKLMLLDSKGAVKWSVDNLPPAGQDFSIVKQDSDFLLLNASGMQLTEIDPDGNDRIKPLIDSALFFAATATSDSTYQYFFSNNSSIRSYDEKGTFLKSVGWNETLISSMWIKEIAGKKYIVIRNEGASEVSIYDLDLQLVNTFSIKEITGFSLCDLFDRQELILLSSDSTGNISCNRLQ